MYGDHSQENIAKPPIISRIPHPNGLSSQPKKMYKKVWPDLKRHYPEMWGRFLDNHYDPQIHQKPFVIAMKTPD